MLDHNTVITFLGRCECPCHTGERARCWCHPTGSGEHPYQISHNDAVHALRACPSPHHRSVGAPMLCGVRTEPRWRAAIDEQNRRNQEQRIMRGQIRNSADINRAIRMGVLPGMRRR